MLVNHCTSGRMSMAALPAAIIIGCVALRPQRAGTHPGQLQLNGRRASGPRPRLLNLSMRRAGCRRRPRHPVRPRQAAQLVALQLAAVIDIKAIKGLRHEVHEFLLRDGAAPVLVHQQHQLTHVARCRALVCLLWAIAEVAMAAIRRQAPTKNAAPRSIDMQPSRSPLFRF